MTYETLAVEIEDGIGTVLVNPPEKLNAYTPRMGQKLPRAFAALDADPSVRAVILSRAGRGFRAAGDLSMFAAQIDAGGGFEGR